MAEATPRPPAIGIDLGTTNSCVAVYQNGKVEVLSNENRKNITPSIVAFTADGKLFGDAASKYSSYSPEECIENIKRIIGRNMKDPTVKDFIKNVSFPVVDRQGKIYIQVKDRAIVSEMRPEEISAMILKHMKSIAESRLGVTVKEAVITVPAYFTESQRRATLDAGKIAGLKVLQILNEPTAAALAYGFDNEDDDAQKLLVYDLGGGTFDVSVMTVNEGEFDVISTDGDNYLGGVDIDTKMVKCLALEFQRTTGLDINRDKRAMRRLRVACEKAKIELSTNHNATLDIASLMSDMDFTYSMTRAWLENLCEDVLDKTKEIVERVLEQRNVEKSTVDEVILVGGSTRMPMIRELMREVFTGKEPQVAINPDEAVAYGAAIQAAILSGTKVRNIRLREVIPMTLGVATKGGIMKSLIERNTRMPAEKTITLTTSIDNQDRITMEVYEGERQLVKHNKLLGELTLAGIPPTQRGVPQIDVTFRVDRDGILNASAHDPATERTERIRLSNRSNLSPESLRKAIQKAVDMDKKDRLQVRKIKAKNKLEYQLSKIRDALRITKLREKIGPEKMEELHKQMEDLSVVVRREPFYLSHIDYENAQNELDEMWSPVGMSLYPSAEAHRPAFNLEDFLTTLQTDEDEMIASQWTDLATESASDA